MKSIKLYAFAAPLALWPLLDVSLNQIPKYLKGLEFRAFLVEIISQVISGVVDAAIIGAVQTAFGVTL